MTIPCCGRVFMCSRRRRHPGGKSTTACLNIRNGCPASSQSNSRADAQASAITLARSPLVLGIARRVGIAPRNSDIVLIEVDTCPDPQCAAAAGWRLWSADPTNHEDAKTGNADHEQAGSNCQYAQATIAN